MKILPLHIALLSISQLLLDPVACAGTNDSLTVKQAVDLVLERNPAIQEASYSIDAAKTRVDLSRGGYLPTAAVDLSYALLEPVATIEFGGLGFNLYPANNYDAHVGIRQPVFDFSKTGSQVDLAGSRVVLAEDSRATLMRDLAFRTVEAFYGIALLRRSVEVQDEQVRTLTEHLATTQKKIASGTATQLDALTTQVRVAAAQTTKINLENALRKTETAFRKLGALPQDTPLNLRGEFSYTVMALQEDSLMRIALAERVEAKAANHAIESAKAQQRASRLNDMPSLNAFAVYGLKNGFMPNLNVLRGNLAAGAQLTIPILDGRRSSSMEEEATAMLNAAGARKREVDLAIQADVHQAVTEMKAALEKLHISDVNIERADKAVENARLRYEAGAVQNIDMLDAATDRAEAKLTNLQALYDVVITSYQLRRAIGSPAVEE
jgi:outer membrane protein